MITEGCWSTWNVARGGSGGGGGVSRVHTYEREEEEMVEKEEEEMVEVEELGSTEMVVVVVEEVVTAAARDLKPENFLFANKIETASLKAIDFGLKMLHPDPKRCLTAQQVLDGKNSPNVSLGETVIVEHLSVEEASGIKERFQVMDTSNKGKITIDELRIGLRKLGIVVSQDDIQILMDAGDVDKDGYLDVNEFVAIYRGYIEIEELRDALANEFDTTSEEVVEAIILDVDTNKVRHRFC
uniref:non-specific serine/threonine protein kinase n=1 Tax=Brassica oleracea var. oleracea TaxID=109376 RepID=A0A0D3BP69_BRAOL